MTEKYRQTSARWGEYKFAGSNIGMTPNIARNKEARIAYIMGYLAAKHKDISKYEARRQRYNLPLRPFNAGYRNNRPEQDSFDYRNYLTSEKQKDAFEHLTSCMGERLEGWAWRDGEIIGTLVPVALEEV
jgi:hypothetical protein